MLAVPRYFRRGKLSGFANVGQIRKIVIPRRRGRCPHRPAGNDRFMAVFRRIRVDSPLCTVGADDPVRPPKMPVLRKSDAKLQHFRGPMWASAPTNNHEKSTNFEGGRPCPPLQMKFDRPCGASIFIHRILAATTVFPAKLSGFANVGQIRKIVIPRRRGRCLHRPAESTYFMVVFRRIRVDFPFYVVGADDPVRPRKMPAHRKSRIGSAFTQRPRCRKPVPRGGKRRTHVTGTFS